MRIVVKFNKAQDGSSKNNVGFSGQNQPRGTRRQSSNSLRFGKSGQLADLQARLAVSADVHPAQQAAQADVGATYMPTDEDLTGDIDRLISHAVIPFVDPSNPMLHFDELKAECRAKLAQIIHDRRLSRCPTRGKALAYLKTSFRNAVRSLVQKHAFSVKRTGVKHPRSSALAVDHEAAAHKLQIVCLDDPEIGFQLGCDDHRLLQGDLIDDVISQLSPSDCAQFDALISNEPEHPTEHAATEDVREREAKALREAQAKLRRKCRAILLG